MQGPKPGTVYVVQFSAGIGLTGGADVHESKWCAENFAAGMRERGFNCRIIEYVTTMEVIDDDMTAARKAEIAEAD